MGQGNGSAPPLFLCADDFDRGEVAALGSACCNAESDQKGEGGKEPEPRETVSGFYFPIVGHRVFLPRRAAVSFVLSGLHVAGPVSQAARSGLLLGSCPASEALLNS